MAIYVGAASGGLWKTTDGGVNWEPIFDGQEASSVSSLAMAQSEPNVLWAGTGETFVIRPAHAMGDGIYRSTDGGNSWEKRGLEATGRHQVGPSVSAGVAEEGGLGLLVESLQQGSPTFPFLPLFPFRWCLVPVEDRGIHAGAGSQVLHGLDEVLPGRLPPGQVLQP